MCNLGSVNLVGHLRDGSLDGALLQRTVRTAIRMLDNVIDLNFYPTPEARQANMRHRPIGLGIMGFQDMLYAMGIPYGSEAAAELADRSMELISFFAIEASCELAGARGSYASFSGSSWSKGEMPIDTIRYLAETRRRGEGEGEELCYVPGDDRLPWQSLRDRVRVSGIRNSNLLAIAPTATISNIVGVSQSIEPSYKNLFVKSNLSGDFTQVNEYLVRDLKARGLWSRELLDELKYYDGALGEIAEVPPELKSLYQTAFEIDPAWIIECAARRQRWLDMGQSLNLYLAEPDGRKLHEMYLRAWKKGLKTTYYLRSLAATQIEKSSLDLGKFKTQPRWMKAASASRTVGACELDPGGSVECDACQ